MGALCLRASLCALILMACISAQAADTHGGLSLEASPLGMRTVAPPSEKELQEIQSLLVGVFHIPPRYYEAHYKRRVAEAVDKLNAGDSRLFSVLLGELFTSLDEPGVFRLADLALKMQAAKPPVLPGVLKVVERLLEAAKVARPHHVPLAAVKVDDKFAEPFVNEFRRVQGHNKINFHDRLADYDRNPEKVRSELLNGTQFDREVLFSWMLNLGDRELQNKLAKALAFKVGDTFYLELTRNSDGKPARLPLGSDPAKFADALIALRNDPKLADDSSAGYSLAPNTHGTGEVDTVRAQLSLLPSPPKAGTGSATAVPTPLSSATAVPKGDATTPAGDVLPPPRPVTPKPVVTPTVDVHAAGSFFQGLIPKVSLPELPKLPSAKEVGDLFKRIPTPRATPISTKATMPDAKTTATPVPPVTPTLDPKHLETTRNALTQSCFKCHGGKDAKGKVVDKGGIDDILDSKKLIDAKEIVPGKPDESPLYRRLIGKDSDGNDDPSSIMPPKDGPLPKETIEAIRQWILHGAPDLKAPPADVTPKVTPKVTEEPKVTPKVTEVPKVTPKVTEEPKVTPKVTEVPKVTPKTTEVPPSDPIPPPRPVTPKPTTPAPKEVTPPPIPHIPPDVTEEPKAKATTPPPAQPTTLIPAPLPKPKLSDAELAKKAHEILGGSCVTCHGKDATNDKTSFHGILDRNRLLDEGHVVAGDPTQSPLLARLEGRGDEPKMPPASHPHKPKAEDIAAIREWIQRGAPNWDPHQGPARPNALLTPKDVVNSVATDLAKVAKDDRPFMRYFSLKHLNLGPESKDSPDSKRAALIRMLNQLSGGNDVVTPTAVDRDGLLLRVDMRQLKWSKEAWAALKEKDPFFKQKQGPWGIFDEKMMTSAQNWVVRGDWFVHAASGGDLYAKLLGIPGTADEIEKKLGVQRETDVSTGKAKRAGMLESGKDGKQRLVQRHDQTETDKEGRALSYWRAYNFGPEGTGNANLFTKAALSGTPGGKQFQHSSGDIAYELPNGMHAYVSVDKSGKVVGSGGKCLECHTSGLRSNDDTVRDNVVSNPELYDEKEKALVQKLYPSKAVMDGLVASDNKPFEKAVAAMKLPSTEKDPVGSVSKGYGSSLTLADAAKELGIAPSELVKRIQADKGLREELGTLLIRGPATAEKPGPWVGKVNRATFDKTFLHLTSPETAGPWTPPAPPTPIPTPIATPITTPVTPKPDPTPQFTHILSSTAMETGQPIFYIGSADGKFFRVDWTGRGWQVWSMQFDPRRVNSQTITPINPSQALLEMLNKTFLRSGSAR